MREWREVTETPKEVWTFFGLKGTGKTMCAFKFPGKKYCFSFDGKSQRIKQFFYGNSPDIVILDPLVYFEDCDPDRIVPSSEKTYNHILQYLEEIERRKDADWIIFDCLEKLAQVCEALMRLNHKPKPLAWNAGVPLGEWKMRKLYMDKLHRLALKASKKGIVYTTWQDSVDEEIEEGEVVRRRQGPAYFGIIRDETDLLIRCFTKRNEEGLDFYVEVVSSKFPRPKTGVIQKVTR